MLIEDLDKAIRAVCPIDGIAEVGNGQFRIDYQSGATSAQRTAAQQILANYTPIPDDAWSKLQAAFIAPGNALYESVVKKATAASLTGSLSYHHFNNLQLCITVISMRRVEGLAFAVNQLNTSLNQSLTNKLSTSEKNQWNALMDQCGFPASCKLSS